jgi:aspartate/methionine/tyrosine aminotransferase
MGHIDMKSPISPFKLERYFAQYEFATEILLCSSDVEGYPVRQLLAAADDEMREAWENLTLGYTETSGSLMLRREIKRLYSTLAEDQIVVTNSGEEPIYILARLLLRPGDHVIAVWPGYQSHIEVARAVGAEVTLLPVRPMGKRWRGDKRWMIDLEDLHSTVRHNTRMLITNFPHNPTGAQPNADEFNAIVQFAREHDLYWLSDEVYRYLEYAPGDRLPAAADCHEKAVSIGAMSKSFAMAGLRIGWAASRNRALLAELLSYKDYTTICNSAPSELLATMALRGKGSVLARSVGLVRENLARANAFFAAHDDLFEWTPPSAGSVGFPRLRTTDADAFADALVRAENTLLLPASVFGYPHQNFRIGLGRNGFEEGLRRLTRFIQPKTAPVSPPA